MEKFLTVEGLGKVNQAPDCIQMEFHLLTTHEKYDKAVAHSREEYSRLEKAMTGAGLAPEELKTSNLQVETWYEQENDGRMYRQVFKGYRISSRLFVEIPLDLILLAKIIENITREGSSPEFSLVFALKNPELLLEEALKNAVLDAKKKAQILTETAGVSLGEILSMTSLPQEGIFPPSRVEMPMLQAKASLDMAMNPRDVETTARVKISFALT